MQNSINILNTSLISYPFGMVMPGKRLKAGFDGSDPSHYVDAHGGDYRYGFQNQEVDDEVKANGNSIDFGARIYDPRIGRWLSRDPLANRFASSSPYSFCINSPLMIIDINGEYPWPIYVRSFISSSTVAAGTFRGDGRDPSTETSSSVTSRVTLKMVYDGASQKVTHTSVSSDFTKFFGIGGVGETTKTAKPSASVTSTPFTGGEGNKASLIKFDYTAKDPVTPEFATPAIDIMGSISISEDLKKNALSIIIVVDGDKFPSTESFIEDQSGQRLLLGAIKEKGGVTDLAGKNYNRLIETRLTIKLDDAGKFIGVKDELKEKTYTVKQWNKKVKSQFK